jgi:hypothetical protein
MISVTVQDVEQILDQIDQGGLSSFGNSILLGMPLVQAFLSEKEAPPFGVFIHESVRAFGQLWDRPVSIVLWRWWSKNEENTRIAAALHECLKSYFDWCRKNPTTSGYSPDRVQAHLALAEEYLGEFEKGTVTTVSASRAEKLESSAPATSDRLLDHEPETTSERQMAKLNKILNLTDEQQDQIKPIIEKREEQVQLVLQDRSLDPEVRLLRISDLVADRGLSETDELTARLKSGIYSVHAGIYCVMTGIICVMVIRVFLSIFLCCFPSSNGSRPSYRTMG